MGTTLVNYTPKTYPQLPNASAQYFNNEFSKISTAINSIENNLALALTDIVDITHSAYGAVAGSTAAASANVTAIRAAITALGSGGGIVFVPEGNFFVNDTITISTPVTIVGAGNRASMITMSTDTTVFSFGAGGARDIWIVGYQNAGATNDTVVVTGNGCSFINVDIWGGLYALNVSGIDSAFYNMFVTGWGTAGGCLLSTGANWYIRCKFDNGGQAATTYGVNVTVPGAGSSVFENHFVLCDFTGNNLPTYSIRINDAGLGLNITVFEGYVINNVLITDHLWTSFIGCEIEAASNTDPIHYASMVGCWAQTAFTATGNWIDGNVGIYLGSFTNATTGAVALTSGTIATVATFGLTPGVWEVGGSVSFSGTATNLSYVQAGINLSAVTVGVIGTGISEYVGANVFATLANNIRVLPTQTLTISASSTVYVGVEAGFSGGTCSATFNYWYRRVG